VCRFGLAHGDGVLGAGATVLHFAYGREITGVAGVAIEQKLDLAYQAAEEALLP
jgi:hypothetical protein